MADRIEVRGLREYRTALRKMDTALGPELRKGLNEVAEVVVSAARPLVPRRTGHAQESMKVGSTQSAAQIKVGGRTAPYYLWLDFGGKVGRNKSVRRPFIPAGRYIYPTLKDKNAEVIDKLDEVLGRLTDQAGF